MDGISLIIPTYKRTVYFERTLNSVSKQSSDIDEVITVIGPHDVDSFNIATSFQTKIANLQVIQSDRASVVHALNLGMQASRYPILSLTDDDIELPEGWAKRIKAAFKTYPDMGGYGGPDKLISNVDKSLAEKDQYLAYNPIKEVGVFKWNGMIGGHHLGIIKSPAVVDVIKGVNFSFRRDTLNDLSIDAYLKDRGAEQCWEIDLIQKVQRNGYKIIFDNDNFLYHYISQRPDFDQRKNVFSPMNITNLRNMAYVYAKFRPFHEVLYLFFSSFIIGSRIQPSFLRALTMIKAHGIKVLGLPFKNSNALFAGLFYGYRFRIKRFFFCSLL